MSMLLTGVWRYLSGHAIDGRPTTNATWLKAGTLPKHHLNWWSRKPRLHKAAYRWAILLAPSGWVLAYQNYRFWTLCVTFGVSVYVIDKVWHKVTRHAPKTVVIRDEFPEHGIENIQLTAEESPVRMSRKRSVSLWLVA